MTRERLRLSGALLLVGLTSPLAWAEPALPPVLIPAPSAALAPPTAPPGTGYTVQRGDTLDRVLLRQFGVAPQALKVWRAQVVAHNPSAFKGRNPNQLIPGRRLHAPPGIAPLHANPATPLPTPERPRAAIYYYGH